VRTSLLVLLMVAGCSDDGVDLGGVYRVDTSVESEPCGVDMPAAMPAVYVKFVEDEIFGSKYYAMEECSDAAGLDCSGGGLFGGSSFSEPIDDGWRGVTLSSSSGGSSDPTCLLFYSEGTAILKGGLITVESSDYSEEVANTEELCTTDEAEKRGTSMMCERHEKLTATKL